MAQMLEKGVEIAVGIMVVILLAAYLLPVAFNAWFNQTVVTDPANSSWSDPVADIWPLIPLFAIIALLLFFIGYAVYRALRR